MQDKVQVPAWLFREMREAGDWKETSKRFCLAMGYHPLGSDNIHGDDSYQSEDEIVMVSARVNYTFIITPEK